MTVTREVPRFMLSAFASNSGKTMMTCTLLKLFKNHGEYLSSYKCGPDYIDTMFHRQVLLTRSTNLDMFLSDDNTIKGLLCENAKNATLSIVEGVMGYYDGLGGKTSAASSNALAELTDTPVVLVINVKGSSMSIVPQINGFLNHTATNKIKAVILNNVNPASYPMYRDMIEEHCNVRVAGYMPHMSDCVFESRHLGLITAMEISDIDEKISRLAIMAESTIDFPLLKQIAQEAPPVSFEYEELPKLNEPVRIAVARDPAFCFYYQDALSMMEQMGAQIIYFSPLEDFTLPKDIGGIILGGGYPELYGKQLAANDLMRLSLRYELEKGIPCIAECGGFMYLLDTLKDKENTSHDMVKFLSGESHMTEKLNRFGYVTLTAQKDTLLLKQGESINAHEFHYSDSTNCGDSCTATKPMSNRTWNCIHGTETLFAGYPHMNLCGKPLYAKRFLEAALKFKRG